MVAVVINVSKRNAVALLQVAEPAGARYILKAFAAVIAKHPVWNNRRKIRISGADVEIQKTVVVEVTEVGAHPKQNMVEAGLGRHVGERAIVIVVVEPWPFGVCRQAQIIGTDISHVIDAVTAHKEI